MDQNNTTAKTTAIIHTAIIINAYTGQKENDESHATTYTDEEKQGKKQEVEVLPELLCNDKVFNNVIIKQVSCSINAGFKLLLPS